MNKLWKRAGSILLTGALLAGTIPFGASAAGNANSELSGPDEAKIKVEYTKVGGGSETAYYSNVDNDDRNNDRIWDPIGDLGSGYKNADTSKPITVTLLDDITLNDTTILVDLGKKVTIDGQEQYSIISNMTNAVTAAEAPGNQAVSIATASEALTLQNVELNINGAAAEGKNANNGIVNYGTFTMGSASVVNIDGVKEGINGGGTLTTDNGAKLTIENVNGSAIKASTANIYYSTVAIDGAGAHGISVTNLSVMADASVTVKNAAYYGIRVSGKTFTAGYNTAITVDGCSQEVLNETTYLPVVLSSSNKPADLDFQGGTWTLTNNGISRSDNVIKFLGQAKGTINHTTVNGDLNVGSYTVNLVDSAITGKLSTAEDGGVYISNSTFGSTDGNVYTGETTEPVAAILHDASGKLEDDELYTDYGITTSAGDNGVVNVAITASDLRKHANGGSGNTEGYWVGFALAAPEGAEQVAYAFGSTEGDVSQVGEPIALEANVTADGKSGIAFYVDASAETPKTWAKVQWAGAEGVPMGEATTYCMDLSDVSMVVEGIKAATLNDTSGAVAKDYLYDAGTYNVTATKTFGSKTYDVAITAKNVRTHYNGNTPTSLGAWVGYAVTAPAGAATMKYAFGDTIPGDAQAYGLEDIFPGQKGVAVYYNAAAPKNTTFTVQWLDSANTGLGTYTYTVDLSGVTVSTAKTIISSAAVKVDDEISPSMQAVISANTIAVSGLTSAEDQTITLDIATTAGGTITKDFPVKYDAETGKFSIDSTAVSTVDICGTEYTVNVSGLAATPSDVEITTGTVPPEVGEGIDDADEIAVSNALDNIDVGDATTAVAQAAAQETAALVSDKKQVATWLEEANTGTPGKYDTIQVVTYLDITATSYSAETGLTLDIVPSYKIVATNGTDTSEALASGVLTTTSTAQPVSITIGLPSGMVSSTDPVYIYHEKDAATTYVYKGTVSNSTGSYTATFENPHGFSTFTVKKSAPAFVTDANNQDTYYPTLQDAVDAAASTDVITLLEDDLTAEITKDVIVKNGTGAPITVTINGEKVSLSAGEKVTVEYVTPGGGIVVGGGGTEEPAVPFTDVKEGDWFYDAVVYAYENDLMQGTSGTAFSPNVKMNRAMLVTILYRLEGEPAVSGDVSFTDVPDAYYTEAVAWAASNGLVEGFENNTFKPTQNITREQFATILYRYAAFKKADTTVSGDLSGFTDAASTSTWAKDAMTWAVDNGIIQGVTPTTLAPQNTATRAQGAAMLMRFIENL